LFVRSSLAFNPDKIESGQVQPTLTYAISNMLALFFKFRNEITNSIASVKSMNIQNSKILLYLTIKY